MGKQTVYLLTHYFYPETAAVAQYMTELAVELKQRDIDITVFTSQATYQREGNLAASENYQGVSICRLWGTRFSKNNVFGRAINLATFLFSAVMILLTTRKRPDLLLIANAPLLGFVGLFVYLLRGLSYACIIEDIYPDLAEQLNKIQKGGLISKIWDAVNFQVYSRANYLIVLGKYMEAAIRRKLIARGADVDIHIINSWADGSQIKPLDKADNWFAREHNLVGKTVVLYSGNHGLAHDLESLIEAAERLQSDDQFVFCFIGEGAKKQILIDMAKAKKLTNVRFLPYQPVEALGYSLTCGDISIVSMEQGVEGLIIPSKIYGSLAAGQVILGLVGEKTEVADIINENNCGFRIAPKDVNQLTNVLKQLAQDKALLANMKANARRCFDERFTKERAINLFYQLSLTGSMNEHITETNSNVMLDTSHLR